MAERERARRTREGVLDAAAEEFAVRGYGRAGLSVVAGRTGRAKDAPYPHFTSGETLTGVPVARSREVWAGILLAQDVPGAGARTALETVVLDLARRLRTDVRLRAALRLATGCPHLAHAMPYAFEEIRVSLVDLIRRAQREDGMPPHPPELVAHLLLAAMHGALHVTSGPAGCAETAGWEAVWRLLLDALAGDGGPRPRESVAGA